MGTGPRILTIRKSRIHGRGCFAASVVARGQIITEYTGEPIDYAEAIRRNNKTSGDYSAYILEVRHDLFLDGARSGNPARFINHSCEPNCRVRRWRGRAFIVARRRLAAGEELTIDYSYRKALREPCGCGARTCRGYM